MKETGKIIKDMASEFFATKTKINILAFDSKENDKEKGSICMQMGINLKGNTSMIGNMDLGNIF